MFPSSVKLPGFLLVLVWAMPMAILLLQPCYALDSSSGFNADIDPQVDSINLTFIFISSNNTRAQTSGSIPAVDIALEMVAESGILGKYKLQYSASLDSQVI